MKPFVFMFLMRLFSRFGKRPDVLVNERADQLRAVYWRDYGRHVEHAISAAGITHYDVDGRRNARGVADYFWRSYLHRELPLEHALKGMRDGISAIKPATLSFIS